MRFDLHIHTCVSPCSRMTMEQAVTRAGELGLDGICITDHDSMEARHWLKNRTFNGLRVLVGMEYTTDEGDFLLFCPRTDIPLGLPARQILSWVESAGGAAVAAHPSRVSRPTGEELISQGQCRIVEGLNGRNRESENEEALQMGNYYGARQTGGSDAHTPSEIGGVVTCFKDPIHDLQDLILVLKYGEYAPFSPFINLETSPVLQALPA